MASVGQYNSGSNRNRNRARARNRNRARNRPLARQSSHFEITRAMRQSSLCSIRNSSQLRPLQAYLFEKVPQKDFEVCMIQ